MTGFLSLVLELLLALDAFVLCPLPVHPTGSLAENAPLAARLTMRFFLPTLICLAVTFHSGSLSSYLPLILFIRSPTNPLQILLPVWNLGGNMTSSICFINILWTSLSQESICCSEKNPWTRHHPDTGSYHRMDSQYFSLLSFSSIYIGGIGKLFSVVIAMLGFLFIICISF